MIVARTSQNPADLDLNTPNLTLPLAASYNTRGIEGFANTVTSALDQRKINSIYEPITNAATQQQTLYLAKRPGVDDSGQSYGTTAQVGYLVHAAPGVFGSSTNQWVFSVSTNDIRASSTSTTTVVATAAGYAPAYVDRAAVGANDTLVLQLKNAAGAQTVWYSTDIATFTQITDGDFTGLAHRGKMEHVDGFAFIMDNTNKAIYNSDLNSLSAWQAVSYIVKQVVQDEAQGLMKFGSKLLGFGSETNEAFVNIGNAEGSVLQRVPNSIHKIGLANQTTLTGSTHYYTNVDDKLYFVGREAAATSLSVYMYNGERFERVSTQAVDKIINDNSGANYSVNKVMFHGKRAIAFALYVTTAATQRWLMFFPDWNDWFEWTSTIYTPVNSGEWFLGVGANQHKLKRISQASSNWQDDGTSYTFTHQFQLPRTGPNQQRMSWFGVTGDTARSASSLAVSFSDDDGQNWSTARNIDLTSKEKLIRSCGAYIDRQIRLPHTANLDVRLEKVVAKIT